MKQDYREAGDGLCSMTLGDRTTNNGLQPQQQKIRLEIRRILLTWRVVKHWNRNPREGGESPSLETFEEQTRQTLGMVSLKMTLP